VGGPCRKAFRTYQKDDCAVQASTKKAVVLLLEARIGALLLRMSGGSGSDAGGWYNVRLVRLERRWGMEEEDGRG